MADVETSAKYISINEKTEEEIYYEINRIFNNYEYFDLVFFMNAQGRMIYSNPYNRVAIEERTYTDRDYYNHVITYEESFVSKLYISRVLNEPHFVLAAPIFENESLHGLLAAGIPLKEMKRVIKDTEVEFNGGIWVIDMFGSLIVNPYQDLSDKEVISFENQKVNMNSENTDVYDLLLRKTEGNFILNREDKNYYVAMTFVDGANLAVLVEQEEEVMLKEAFEIINDLKFAGVIIIAVGIILGIILSVGITRPIQKLVYNVRMWSNGENKFEAVEASSKSELGELSNTFKEMADSLDKKVDELKASVLRENQIQQYLNNILMSAGSGIIVVDSDKKIIIFNRAAEMLSGYKRNSVIGYNYRDFSDKIHFDMESMIEKLDKSKEETLEKEVLILNSEKRNIPCRVICSKITEIDENQTGYVFLINNLEVIKKMEEELQREDRLSIVGEFSSSIIHDIGNPLAGLSNLLELYKSDITDANEKKDIMDLIEDEIKELNDIVLSFLSFARSKNEEEIQVNICQIVSEAVNILRSEMINRDIKLHFYAEEDLMYANVDRRNFKQAVINIIKNSIQAININGILDVKIYWNNKDIVIKIKDTGVGIKEDEIQYIFEPFYTTKKDGTGLGLSTAYKTIRDNEGKLEVKSKYKEGSEFIITVPGRRKLDEHINN
jgi:PAS domain S-box-containing protein